ncbi:hypothetical protein ATANTOWER_028088 [Ataeniobius toweri]|uniref:UAP56-interacting factor n=1 Tax=Ataeniobius toweri TaxID=208326 RepID=A0ABU7ARB5_9TELE|nr:hypothetical protein [Ataeniobius toweri]
MRPPPTASVLLCRPPTAWTLHPPPVSSAPVKVEMVEKKVPKGVPLQFDINSVGKPVRTPFDLFLQMISCHWLKSACRPLAFVLQQTSMTLNERFRILKDRRVATAQSSRGSRFVTVG